jgi:hypothetical protein
MCNLVDVCDAAQHVISRRLHRKLLRACFGIWRCYSNAQARESDNPICLSAASYACFTYLKGFAAAPPPGESCNKRRCEGGGAGEKPPK